MYPQATAAGGLDDIEGACRIRQQPSDPRLRRSRRPLSPRCGPSKVRWSLRAVSLGIGVGALRFAQLTTPEKGESEHELGMTLPGARVGFQHVSKRLAGDGHSRVRWNVTLA